MSGTRANLSKLDVPALIQEKDALSRVSYLYPNQSTRNHFSKSMPYQLLNHLFILYLSLAGTMVTPYSLQIIPDDEELKEEEDQLVEEARERGGPKERRWQNSHLRARLQGGPLRLQKGAGRDCARLRPESCREEAGNS